MGLKASLGLPFTVLAYLGIILIVLGIISIMVLCLNPMPNLIWIGVVLFIIGLIGATFMVYYCITNNPDYLFT